MVAVARELFRFFFVHTSSCREDVHPKQCSALVPRMFLQSRLNPLFANGGYACGDAINAVTCKVHMYVCMIICHMFMCTSTRY